MSDVLIEGSVPNMVNGVSQQAPSLRRVDQCEAQENCRNSLVEGMGKRFNSVLMGKISGSSSLGGYHISEIERDAYEKYKVMVSDAGLRVIDSRTAADYPVVIVDAAALTYLRRQGDLKPERAYQVLTTIDNSLILNKTVPIKPLPFVASNDAPDTTEQRTAIISLIKSTQGGGQINIVCATS